MTASIVDLGSFKIAVAPDDHDISRQLSRDRWYSDERFQTDVFAGLLRPGMRVLDIGANIGFYTLLARSIVGAEGSVVAFEPYPRSTALLRSSIQANGYANVELVEAAASDAAGRARLFLSPEFWTEHSLLDLEFGAPGPEGYSIDVPLVTVDAALERLGGGHRVDVVKIDIEGWEWRALQGMQRVLRESPGMVLVTEFWPNGILKAGGTPARYLQTLHEAGFTFHEIDNEAQRLAPATAGDLLERAESSAQHTFENPVMQAWGWYTNLLCTRG
ncbi:MAG TPA: FkbM family methyltransferase [Longimicrobium sp.]|nr:FkbM family methyltransferase [Longimicrobium sp.]